MTSLRSRLASLYRTLFRSGGLDRELDAELDSFIAERTQYFIGRGMSHDAARRAAVVEAGGAEQVKEQVRDVRIGMRLETGRRDIVFGLRSIRRTPGFALIIIATFALCIGANVTMFSVMHAVLWRGLPYPDADRLVVVDAEYRSVPAAGISHAEARDLRREPGLFDALAVMTRVDAHLTGDGEYERVPAASATDDVFALLGALPLAFGRPLEARRDHGADGYINAVVISHDLWQRRYHGDPAAVGRRIDVNNLPAEIVGVLPPGFRVFLPANAAFPEIVDVWFPRGFDEDRRSRGQVAIARLAPGVALEAAGARVDALGQRFVTEYAGDYAGGAFRLHLRPLHDVLTADAKPALWALTAAVWLVLVIGCVNIANLMLARARARAPEIAMRRALGASRPRLVSQFLAESAVLATLGAASGFLLAYAGVEFVEWLRPSHLPRQSQITIDPTAAAYTVALAALVSAVFGLVPAFAAGQSRTADALRTGRANVQRGGARRIQRGLVIAEVALSIVPLVAAGLMLRTFVNLRNAPIGFEPEGLLTAKMALSARTFPTPAERIRIHQAVLARLAQEPGVHGVAAASPLPFDEHQFTRNYGRTTDPLPLVARATMQSVFPGYIGLAGVRLLAGRDFTMDDLVNERPVVIVDERLARQLFPNGAVGQPFALGRGRTAVPLEIIGVTDPVRVTRVRDDALPHFFLPYHLFTLEMALVVRTNQPASAVAPAIKRIAASVGTRRPVYEIRPMRDYVDGSFADTRFTMLVLVGFGAAAILLAAIGLYGTLAYLTSQRTQEFGVRLALGAPASRVLWNVAGEGLWLTALGALAGLAGAAAVSTWLRTLLYQVTPFDAGTLVAVSLLVAAIALIAASHPAWRAARIDPATALRTE